MSGLESRLRPLQRYLKVDNGDKAGLYLTIIVHLVAIIILLSWSIHVQLSKDTSFLIDFSAQEEQERLTEQTRMQESVKEELDAEIDALLNASRRQDSRNIRNVAVDASEHLRDDRHDNPEDIYRDARELQERLDRTRPRTMRTTSPYLTANPTNQKKRPTRGRRSSPTLWTDARP